MDVRTGKDLTVNLPGSGFNGSTQRGPSRHVGVVFTGNRVPDSQDAGNGLEPEMVPCAGSGREAEEEEDY